MDATEGTKLVAKFLADYIHGQIDADMMTSVLS